MKERMKLSVVALLFILAVFLLISIIIPHDNSLSGIPVLGYHGVVEDEVKEHKYPWYPYAVSKSEFEEQMKYLYDHHYKTLSLKQFDKWYSSKSKKQKCVVLTFDDGYSNFNTIVKPILKKYGFKATCFVIGKHIAHPTKGFLCKKDLKKDKNVQYYSHSYNMHKTVEGFDRKIIQNMKPSEIDRDFKMRGVSHKYFAYPYGRSISGIDDILMNNHVRMAFGYNQFVHATRDSDRYYIPRYMVLSITPFLCLDGWYHKLKK
jgi:peptidoglycan/xylan/chitin deacetylase (PgdA/CDA1 family)